MSDSFDDSDDMFQGRTYQHASQMPINNSHDEAMEEELAEAGKTVFINRKLPGPAGDLSHLNADDFMNEGEELHDTTRKLREKNRNNPQKDDEKVSPTKDVLTHDELTLEMNSWKAMVQYVMKKSTSKTNNLKVSFSDITNSKTNRLSQVSAIGVVIRHVISYETNASCLVLVGEYQVPTAIYHKDHDEYEIDVKPSSSTLKVNIAKSAMDKYKTIATAGSVVLLRGAPIYRPSPDSHYLIATEKTVVNVWTSKATIDKMNNRRRKRQRLSHDESSQDSTVSTDSVASELSSQIPSNQTDFDRTQYVAYSNFEGSERMTNASRQSTRTVNQTPTQRRTVTPQRTQKRARSPEPDDEEPIVTTLPPPKTPSNSLPRLPPRIKQSPAPQKPTPTPPSKMSPPAAPVAKPLPKQPEKPTPKPIEKPIATPPIRKVTPTPIPPKQPELQVSKAPQAENPFAEIDETFPEPLAGSFDDIDQELNAEFNLNDSQELDLSLDTGFEKPDLMDAELTAEVVIEEDDGFL
jgi:outer membrane biosynthesis protein TonB